MGLLGGNEADYFDRPHEETVKSAIEYFRDTEVSPFASSQTRDLHEKVQKRQAINDRRRELSDLQDIINSPLDDEQKLEAIREYRQKSSELLRLEKDSGTGIVQVREGHDWVDKQDASYFAQMTRKTEEGEEHYFKELFRDNGRWKYRADDGSLVEFDPTADGAKMAVGTKILTRAQDGSVKATNYQWTNGFLTRTTDDGMTTNVVQDAEGNYISMDSEIGKAIYSSSEDGILNQDLIAAIEANQSNLVTVLSRKDLQIGAGARRHAAAAADETKDSVREEKIRELANQYVDSTGAIGRIDPVKVEMEGETFYMLTGSRQNSA